MCDEEPEPGGAGWASAPGAPAVTAGHAACILLPGPQPALLSFRPVLSPALRCPAPHFCTWPWPACPSPASAVYSLCCDCESALLCAPALVGQGR